ncbi:MAG: hypothetical protein ACPL25_06615, partial [Ignavibacteria bacterium]
MKVFKIIILFLYLIFLFQLSLVSLAKDTNEKKRSDLDEHSKALSTRKTYLIDINRLKIPINNSGVIADVPPIAINQYDESDILFSAGF